MKYPIDKLVGEWVKRLQAESSRGVLAQIIFGCAGGTAPELAAGDKIARLMENARVKERLFRYCEPIHYRILCARFVRVMAEPEKRFVGHADMKTRRLRAQEIADYFGLTYDQYRRTLTEANRRVARAVDEFDRRLKSTLAA